MYTSKASKNQAVVFKAARHKIKIGAGMDKIVRIGNKKESLRKIKLYALIIIPVLFFFSLNAYSDDSLNVDALTVPSTSAVGQTITVIMNVQDNGDGHGLNNVSPGTLKLTNSTGNVTFVQVQPTLISNIPAYAHQFFTFIYNATYGGTIEFTNDTLPSGYDASDNDPVTALNPQTSTQIIIDDTLTIASMNASPATVSLGQIITVIMTLSDTGSNGLNTVSPGDLALTNIFGGGNVTSIDVQPSTILSMAPNSSGAFTFTYNATGAGSFQFINNTIPNATAPYTDDTVYASNSPLSNQEIIQTPASLLVSGITAPAAIAVGQTISVAITVQNTGQAGATGVLPNPPVLSGLTGAITPVSTPVAQNIAGGSSATFTYTYSANSPASVIFYTNGGISGKDANSGIDAGWTDTGYNAETIIEATLGELIVNSNADYNDGMYGNGHDTLRECMAIAESLSTATTIHFSPSIANTTITLTNGSLPHIANASAPVIIDGGNNNITINGNSNNIFYISSSNGNKILNLSMINGAFGVYIINGNSNLVSGCRIGIDWNGNVAGNNYGIFIVNASGNTIGGDAIPGSSGGTVYGNVISNSVNDGILMTGSSYNMVLSNFIGTDASGTVADPNGSNGIHITGGSYYNSIGYNNSGNLISGNNGNGIQIDSSSYENGVFGNVIGCNVYVLTGNKALSAAISNNDNGIEITGIDAHDAGKDYTAIGSYNPLEGNGTQGSGKYDQPGNTIAANAQNGIYVTNYSSSAYIGNNSIGLIFGNTSAGNGLNGILIDYNSNNSYIVSNLISGHTGGSGIGTSSANNCYIYQNIVGLDSTLSNAKPNTVGMDIKTSSYIYVGQQGSPSSGNVIAANTNQGILLDGGNYNEIYGNYIGTNLSLNASLGNAEGIAIIDNATFNEVGGSVGSGDENYIMDNSVNGVQIGSGTTDSTGSNFINSNYITNNNGLGIDLGNDGITVNGLYTFPTAGGPNGWAYYPTITNAYMADSNTLHVDGITNITDSLEVGVVIGVSDNDGQQGSDSVNHGECPMPIAYVTGITGGQFHVDIDTSALPTPDLGGYELTSYNISTYGSSEFSANASVFAAEPSLTATTTYTVTQTSTFTVTVTYTITPTITPMCACVTTQHCFTVENPADPGYVAPAYEYDFENNLNDSLGGLNAVANGTLKYDTGMPGKSVGGFLLNSAFFSLCPCQLRQKDCVIDWDEYIDPAQDAILYQGNQYGPAILDAVLGQGVSGDTSSKGIAVFLDEDGSNPNYASIRVGYTLNYNNGANNMAVGGLTSAGWYNIRVSWTGAQGEGSGWGTTGAVKLVVVKDSVGMVGEQDSPADQPNIFWRKCRR